MSYRTGTLATIVLIVLGAMVIMWYVPQELQLYIGAGLLLFARGCYRACSEGMLMQDIRSVSC